MSLFSRPPRRWSKMTAILAEICCCAGLLCAQTTVDAPQRSVQRIHVPDQRPETWPFRDINWVPRDRDEFEREFARWTAAAAAPLTPEWQRIRYSATLTGNTLTAGRFDAELRQSPGRTSFLQLGNPSLAIDEIFWAGKPAVWGADLQGRHWLKREDRESHAEGRWTARGRSLTSGVVFELELLPAALSELELFTPRGYRISSDVGEVSEVATTADAVHWRIHLGSQIRCRLIVSNQEDSRSPAPAILYEQELVVAVSQEELQLQQTIKQLEVLEADIDQLTMSLPRQVEITSVSYGDKPLETPLMWKRLAGEGPLSQLVLTFPEKVRGRLRPIRIDGFQRRGAGETLTLPQFSLDGAIWLDGRLSVNVLRPLEIRSCRPTGYRQDGPIELIGANSSTEGELIKFRQLTPRAQLVLNLERPTPERAAHVLNALTVDNDVWTLTAELAWESRAGTVFDASCRFPDGWQVVSVVQLSGGRNRRELVGWKVQPHPEAGQMLLLEFPDGLTSGRVEPVRVIARRVESGISTPAYLPLMIPLDCELSEVVLTLPVDVQNRFSAETWTSFERIDPAAPAAAVWNTLPAWGETHAPARAWFRLVAPDSLVSTAKIPREEISQADVHVSMTLGVAKVEERWEIRVNEPPPSRRVELYFPESGEGIVWASNHDQPLAASRATSPSRSLGNLPSHGELWSVTLPEANPGEPVVMLGVRRGDRQDREPVPLVFIPQARQFQGQVTVTSEEASTQELREQPVRIDAARSELQHSAEKRQEIAPESALEWNYHTWDREWIVVRHQPRVAAPRQAWFSLESILSADEQGYDYHKLRVTIREPGDAAELRFQLSSPAEFIAVLRDGKRLSLITSDAQLVVPAGTTESNRNIDLLYRVPVTAAFCRTEHELALPTIDCHCAGFEWSVWTPPSAIFVNEPLGLPMTPQLSRPGWFQRLCGPLARRNGERVFLPVAAWMRDVPAATAQPLNEQTRASLVPPTGLEFPEAWPVYRATDIALPGGQRFASWSRDQLDLSIWVATLSCILAGVVLRRTPDKRQTLWAGFALAVAASLALFISEPWNEIAGGACGGLVLAFLLPLSLLRTWPAVSTPPEQVAGTTATFQRQIVSTALLLTASLAIGRGFAADGPNRPAARDDASLRVLIPVDSEGQPSRKMPLVFVSPALSEQLRQQAQQQLLEPDQLIHAVDYVLYTDQNRRLAMKVKYQIDEFSGESSLALRVPVGADWAKGLETCSVDGQPQQPTRAAEGDVLILPLPATTPAGDSPAASRRHEVVLDIRLPSAADELRDKLVLDTFPVLNSRLSWQLPTRMPHVDLPTARGAVSLSLDQRQLEAQLGAVRQVAVVWGQGDRPPVQPVRTELKVSQLLTLRPSLAQSTFRISCQVLEGAPEHLELRLPAGTVLRDLYCHKLLRTTTRLEPNGTVSVAVEFSEPQRQEFAVEGELILPRTSENDAVEAPRLDVRCGDAAEAAPVRTQLAVACGPEFVVKPVYPDDSAVFPITIEQFVSNWGDTVPTQGPQAAFQLQDGARPAFRLVAKTSEQQILSWDEDVRVLARRLDWRLTVDVRTSDLPIYSHTLLLDRRLKIESASVQENGVERLWRWSTTPSIGFSQNRVTLFFNRELSGTFQLRIHASMPIRPSSSVVLPSVHFEDARAGGTAAPATAAGTISLSHEPGYRLELEGRQAPAEEQATVPPRTPADARGKHFKTLRILEGETGLSIRLEPAAGRSTAQLGVACTASGKVWKLHGWLRLVPLDGTREIHVSVPDWMRDCRFLTEDGAVLPLETDEAGRRMLTVDCAADGSARVLRWDWETTPPEESDWTLDLPDVQQAAAIETFFSPPIDWQGTMDGAQTLTADALPVDVLALFPPDSLTGNARMYRLAGSRIHLLRREESLPEAKSSVLLVDHHLLGMPDGAWHGQTDFYPASSAGTLDVQLPDGLETVGVAAGGQMLSRGDWQQSEQHLLIPQVARYHVISVLWRQPPSGAGMGWVQQKNLALPNSAQSRSAIVLLTITPPRNLWLLGVSGFVAGDPLVGAFERLETLSRRYVRQLAAGIADPEFSDAIRREYQQAVTQISRHVRRGQLPAEQKQRWETITQFVNQLPPAGAQPTVSRSVAAQQFDLWETAGSRTGRLAEGSVSIRCWSVSRPLAAGTAAAVFLICAAIILPYCVRGLLSSWMERHRHAAWLLFGLIWWLCWTPSIVGFAIIAGTMFHGLWQRRSGLSPFPA